MTRLAALLAVLALPGVRGLGAAVAGNAHGDLSTEDAAARAPFDGDFETHALAAARAGLLRREERDALAGGDAASGPDPAEDAEDLRLLGARPGTGGAGGAAAASGPRPGLGGAGRGEAAVDAEEDAEDLRVLRSSAPSPAAGARDSEHRRSAPAEERYRAGDGRLLAEGRARADPNPERDIQDSSPPNDLKAEDEEFLSDETPSASDGHKKLDMSTAEHDHLQPFSENQVDIYDLASFVPSPAPLTAYDYAVCFHGGKSGPTLKKALTFEDALLPNPPMSISARIKTKVRQQFQTILGWGSGPSAWDNAQLRLTAMGNLQFGTQDGFAWHHIEASPQVDLADGFTHTVTVVRYSNASVGQAQLFVDGNSVGRGVIAGAPRIQLNLARTARTMWGEQDYPFAGKVERIFIYRRSLSNANIRMMQTVPCKKSGPSVTHLRFDKAKIHSNLGSTSIGGGEDCIRLSRVAEYQGVVLDLVVTNLTEYMPRDAQLNSLYGFGNKPFRLNLLTGTSVKLRFELMASGTSVPVVVDNFYFTFCDINMGENNTAKESVTINTPVAKFFSTEDTELIHAKPTGKSSLAFMNIDPTSLLKEDKTQDLDSLNALDERQAFMILVSNSSGFEATLKSTSGIGGRVFAFGGKSALSVDGLNFEGDQGSVESMEDAFKSYEGGEGGPFTSGDGGLSSYGAL